MKNSIDRIDHNTTSARGVGEHQTPGILMNIQSVSRLGLLLGALGLAALETASCTRPDGDISQVKPLGLDDCKLTLKSAQTGTFEFTTGGHELRNSCPRAQVVAEFQLGASNALMYGKFDMMQLPEMMRKINEAASELEKKLPEQVNRHLAQAIVSQAGIGRFLIALGSETVQTALEGWLNTLTAGAYRPDRTDINLNQQGGDLNNINNLTQNQRTEVDQWVTQNVKDVDTTNLNFEDKYKLYRKRNRNPKC